MYTFGLLLRVKTLFSERYVDFKFVTLYWQNFQVTNVLIQFVSFYDSQREKRTFEIAMISFEMW